MCLLAQLSAFAQIGPTRAVLTECIKEEDPSKCTSDKLKSDVLALITPTIITNLPPSAKAYFSVSVAFMTDANGTVIKENTLIKSPSYLLNKSIKSYVDSLPVFTPKHPSIEERRSMHFVSFTLLRNDETLKYYVAESIDLRERKIKPDYVLPDEASLYPGCEKTGNYNNDFSCTQKKVYDYIIKNYKVPNVKASGQIKMIVTFSIDTKGVINIDNIEGGEYWFQKEARRVIETLPTFTPTFYKGMAIAVSFNLPITLNLN